MKDNSVVDTHRLKDGETVTIITGPPAGVGRPHRVPEPETHWAPHSETSKRRNEILLPLSVILIVAGMIGLALLFKSIGG